MKNRPSKLDPHAERLTEWFLPISEGGKGLTYGEAKEQLRQDGVATSEGRLCEWWQRRQSERLQERLLQQITSGARQVQDVNEAFALNPAPGMETIANLHRLLAFQLATQGAADPALLDLSTKMTKVVLDFGKLEAKKADQKLAERRVAAMEKKLQEAREVATGSLSAEEKAKRMREIFAKS